MFKLDLEKAEEPEIKLPTSVGSQKMQGNSRKTSISAALTMLNPLTVWVTTNCGKFLRDGNTRPPNLPPEKSVCRSRSNSQNWTWNNRMVQNWERSMSRLYIVTMFIYLTYMQSTSCETTAWMTRKLESRLLGEISPPQISRWYHPNGRKQRGTKETRDKGERQWKSWLKDQHSKNQDQGI